MNGKIDDKIKKGGPVGSPFFYLHYFSLQVIYQRTALGIGGGASFEEVGANHVGVGVVGDPFHAAGLFVVAGIDGIQTEAGGAEVAEVANVVDAHLAVEPLKAIANDVFGPGDFLFRAFLNHALVFILQDGAEEIRIFLAQGLNDVAEQPQMRIFIAIDVANLLGRTSHAAVTCEIVEEHEATVEIDAFQDVVANHDTHEVVDIRLLLEVIINITNEGIALQEVLVVTPLEEDIVAFIRITDGVKHVAVALRVNAFLIGLNVQTEVCLVGGDVLGD